MFVGESASGELVNLLRYSKQEIHELSAKKWRCPSCGELLIIKNGPVMSSHFAHRVSSACGAFSEGETPEHLAGKRLIAEWCEKVGITYQLEAYLPALKQRPDLLINQQVAVEFQCSPLSLARMVERTTNYQKHGFEVIWLVGRRFFLQKKLTAFQRACLNYHENVGFYFWELDVTRKRWHCHYHIEESFFDRELYFATKRWSVGQNDLLKVLRFPQQGKIFVSRSYDVASRLSSLLHKIESGLVQQNQKMLRLQEQLYQQGTHLRELSLGYFLPVTESLLAKETVLLWRLVFWRCLSVQKELTFPALCQSVCQQLKARQELCFVMPLIRADVVIQLFVAEYLKVLADLKFIQFEGAQVKVIRWPKAYPDSTTRGQQVARYLRNYKQISATPHKNMIL